MNPWSDEAIVLGSRKSNESNRVVFLLTRGHGRIAAAANASIPWRCFSLFASDASVRASRKRAHASASLPSRSAHVARWS